MQQTNALVITLASLALLLASPAFSAEPAAPAPTATPSPGQLGPVVTTAQRHPTPVDATSRQTYIITTADLERVGALTAADALRFVPGSVVFQYGPYGSLATASLRGASSLQTLVLIDGQPANEADTGDFDFSSLPVNVIDHVEVVAGGASTLYGSAAMGGVINIITRHPVSAGNINFAAQMGYQGAFMRALGVTLGGPDLLARVDAQAVSTRNSFAYPAFDKLYPAGVRTNTDTKTTDLGIALTGHLGAVVANASLHNDTSAVGAPGSVFFASDFARQQRVYQRVNLDFDLPLAHGDVDFQIASNGRRLHFFDTSPSFPYDNQANGDGRSASLRTTLELGRSHVVTAGYDTTGAEVRFDQSLVSPNAPLPQPCQGATSFDSCTAQSASTAWYVQDELHAPNGPVTLSAGLRNQRSQGTQPVSVPSVGAVLQLSKSINVRANYARAFRTPNLDERYFPGYGSPKLQPEYGATFDV
ncbi:MAG TPA: TonB-dependent receptor, partial [Candidatus Acidoferrales bacterium]|nr:TonB-dependent receptor [Candidatus Acidoferrales bacterium]